MTEIEALAEIAKHLQEIVIVLTINMTVLTCILIKMPDGK